MRKQLVETTFKFVLKNKEHSINIEVEAMKAFGLAVFVDLERSPREIGILIAFFGITIEWSTMALAEKILYNKDAK